MELLRDIPVQLDPEKVLERLHLGKEKHLKDVQESIEIAHSIINPKVIYEASYVTNKNEKTVDIDGISFTSRVLRVNLDRVEQVFPYIMTIGKELENKTKSIGNMVKHFCLETIGNIVLDTIGTHLEDYLKRKYKLRIVSEMNPGSLEDWPITQQEQLFSVFNNVENLIGVKLTDSFLMIPRKSVSGIYFPTKVKFYSCQLCPKKHCEERLAPYDENLEDKYRRIN